MEEKLLNALKPLYAEMMTKITIDEDKGLVPFCVQWGENFPAEENTGILFVGRATNGWVTTSMDTEVLFGTTNDGIFARPDQMKWVHNHERNKDYNSNKSAFWRVIKRVTQAVYGPDEWYSRIGWSNLFKVSYEAGNPYGQLVDEQKELCKKILKTEIEILSPRFVVFLTSDYEVDFVKYLNGETQPWQEPSNEWGGKYDTDVFLIGDTVLIVSYHPQGKPEDDHVEAIVKIIEKYR